MREILLAALAMLAAPLAWAQASGYRIQPGDVLAVAVLEDETLNQQSLVTPDGRISVPLAGTVEAAGRTVEAVEDTIADRLASNFAVRPNVFVSVVSVSEEEETFPIYVLGQVNKPGEFIVNPSVNIMQALSMAGGMTPFAATNDIIVLRGQGKQQNAMAFRYNEVVRGRNLDTNIELLSGDIVVVP